MYASEGGRTEVVKLLIGKGAAVDAKDKNGRTALTWASGRTEVAKLLLGKGDEHVTADMVQVVTNERTRTNERTDEGRNGGRNGAPSRGAGCF